jgi:plastocyanin
MGELMDREPRGGGEVIIEYADRDGVITEDDDRFAGYAVTDVSGADSYGEIEGIDHNIASVFWDFMNSEGVVYENGEYVDDQPLFLNAFYAVGYPLTDAFWADVMVEGVVQDVLIQCFERRCLTYTPGNPEGWEVESGNIGQHYYDWRYHQIDREDPVDPVEPPIEPTDFTFTVDGEIATTIGVGDEITLTAHVTANGENVEGVPVQFAAEDDGGDVLDIAPPLEVETDAAGNAHLTVTGIGEGTVDVDAVVTIAGEDQVQTVTVTVEDVVPEPETHTVTMTDTAFTPAEITISAGDTVVWENTSNVEHTVTSDDFESEDSLVPGATHEVTFTEPGEYDYICTIHVGMTGTVIVE